MNNNQAVFTMTHFDLDSSTGALVNVSKTKGIATFAEDTDDVMYLEFQTDIHTCAIGGCDPFDSPPTLILVGSGIARRIPVEAPDPDLLDPWLP